MRTPARPPVFQGTLGLVRRAKVLHLGSEKEGQYYPARFKPTSPYSCSSLHRSRIIPRRPEGP